MFRFSRVMNKVLGKPHHDEPEPRYGYWPPLPDPVIVWDIPLGKEVRVDKHGPVTLALIQGPKLQDEIDNFLR